MNIKKENFKENRYLKLTVILILVLIMLNLFSFKNSNIYARAEMLKDEEIENINEKYLEIEGKGAENIESGKAWKAELKEDEKREEKNKETKTSLKKTKRIYILLFFTLTLSALTYIYLKKHKDNIKAGDIFNVQEDKESMF